MQIDKISHLVTHIVIFRVAREKIVTKLRCYLLKGLQSVRKRLRDTFLESVYYKFSTASIPKRRRFEIITF
jgi:hypothetical protein